MGREASWDREEPLQAQRQWEFDQLEAGGRGQSAWRLVSEREMGREESAEGLNRLFSRCVDPYVLVQHLLSRFENENGTFHLGNGPVSTCCFSEV